VVLDFTVMVLRQLPILQMKRKVVDAVRWAIIAHKDPDFQFHAQKVLLEPQKVLLNVLVALLGITIKAGLEH